MQPPEATSPEPTSPDPRPQTADDDVPPAPPFSLGVASGWPSADSVVLWTRLMGLPADHDEPVHWQVASTPTFDHPLAQGQALAPARLAHSVHVQVQGLPSKRWLYYRFSYAGRNSPVGRTRTLPAQGQPAQPLRLVWASCQRWDLGYFDAWRHVVADAPDLIVFVGDAIYEYPRAREPVRSGVPAGASGWARTLDDYRARYALYRSDPGLRAAHAAAPWVSMWDDHEVQNDYAGLHPGNGAGVDDFAARRAAAYQAYFEHMPLPPQLFAPDAQSGAPPAELRLYAAFSLGALGRLITLDTRQYRDAQACTPRGASGGGLVDVADCPSWNDPQRRLLGPVQAQWLRQQLQSGSAQAAASQGWTLLAQPTLLGQREFRHSQAPLRRNDGWDGYPAARARLLAALQGVPDVLVLGGDVHEFWVGRIPSQPEQPQSASLGVEFCAASIAAHGGGNAKRAHQLARNPHFIFADGASNGYGLIDLSAEQALVRLRVIDDARLARTRIATLATFRVQRGHPEPERLD